MFNDEEKFDLKIRSVLEGGREEVPDHIWDRIEARLDGATPSAVPHKRDRHVLMLWLRRAGTGIAAAAAITGAFIFSGLLDRKNSPEIQYSSPIAVIEDNDTTGQSGTGIDNVLIAQATPEEVAPAQEASLMRPSGITDAQMQEGIPGQGSDIAAGEEEVSAETLSEQAMTASPAPETAPEQESVTGGTEKAGQEKGQETEEESFSDFFEEMPEDGGRRRIRTSLTISGNAISNTNSENSSTSYMMAPGSGSTGIRELEEGNNRFGIPVSVGAGIKLGFTPKWSMSIGLNYSFLTRTFDGIYTEEGKNPVEYSDIRNSQHYVGIPVNVYYNIVQKNFIDFYAYAGGAAELCVANKYTADDSGRNLYYRGDTGSVQLSANIGIGVEFLLTDHLGLYIDPSLRYYFRNSKAPKSIRTVQPLMLGFEAGFRIRL